MTKEEYKVLLQDPRWKSCSLAIKKRDGFKCRGKDCCNTTNLQVHHKKYIEGRMPWEVPYSLLITLCEECHKKAHEGIPISSFIEKDKNPKIKNKKKKQKPINSKKKKKTTFSKRYYSSKEKQIIDKCTKIRNQEKPPLRVFTAPPKENVSLSDRYKKLKEEGKIA